MQNKSKILKFFYSIAQSNAMSTILATMIKQRPQLLHNVLPQFGNDRNLPVNQNQSTKIAN